MRSSLEEVATVSDVEADCGARICSFKANLDQVDVGVRLHEISYKNKKLKGWSLAKMEPVVVESDDSDSETGDTETGDLDSGDTETPDADESSESAPMGDAEADA